MARSPEARKFLAIGVDPRPSNNSSGLGQQVPLETEENRGEQRDTSASADTDKEGCFFDGCSAPNFLRVKAPGRLQRPSDASFIRFRTHVEPESTAGSKNF